MAFRRGRDIFRSAAEYTVTTHREKRKGHNAMDVDLIFKIAAVGIIVSILNQVLSRSGREEQATMTTLTGLVVVLMIVAQKISDLFELVKRLFDL